MNKTVTMVVSNQPDVLLRVISVFTRYNVTISSFHADPSDEEGLAVYTFRAGFEEKWYDLALKQLKKLIDVIEIKVE